MVVQLSRDSSYDGGLMEDSIYQASVSDVSVHDWLTMMLLNIAAKG